MPTKTTGLEFKRFYNDPDWWPKGRWHEGEVVELNGVPLNEYDYNLGDVADTDRLKISGGFVYDDNDDQEYGSFEGYIRKWLRTQTTAVLSVEAPKEKVEAVKSAIVAAGGRVVK